MHNMLTAINNSYGGNPMPLPLSARAILGDRLMLGALIHHRGSSPPLDRRHRAALSCRADPHNAPFPKLETACPCAIWRCHGGRPYILVPMLLSYPIGKPRGHMDRGEGVGPCFIPSPHNHPTNQTYYVIISVSRRVTCYNAPHYPVRSATCEKAET